MNKDPNKGNVLDFSGAGSVSSKGTRIAPNQLERIGAGFFGVPTSQNRQIDLLGQQVRLLQQIAKGLKENQSPRVHIETEPGRHI